MTYNYNFEHITDTNDITIFHALDKMLPETFYVEDVEEALNYILFANIPYLQLFSEEERDKRKKRIVTNYMMNKKPIEEKSDLASFCF